MKLIFFYKKNYFLEQFLGKKECSFDKPDEIFPDEPWNFFGQKSENIPLKFGKKWLLTFSLEILSAKTSNVHEGSSSDTRVESK